MFGIFNRTKTYEELTGVEFKKKIKEDKNAVVLDVRTEGEFKMGHLERAINIDMLRSDFPLRISALRKDKTYYVYCRSGNRSGKACSLLKSQGYEAYNLAGGISNWDGNITA